MAPKRGECSICDGVVDWHLNLNDLGGFVELNWLVFAGVEVVFLVQVLVLFLAIVITPDGGGGRGGGVRWADHREEGLLPVRVLRWLEHPVQRVPRGGRELRASP